MITTSSVAARHDDWFIELLTGSYYIALMVAIVRFSIFPTAIAAATYSSRSGFLLCPIDHDVVFSEVLMPVHSEGYALSSMSKLAALSFLQTKAFCKLLLHQAKYSDGLLQDHGAS